MILLALDLFRTLREFGLITAKPAICVLKKLPRLKGSPAVLANAAARLHLLYDKPLEITLLAPVGEQVEKRQRTFWVDRLQEAALTGPLAVIVARRADALVLRHRVDTIYNRHPLGFGFP